MSHFYLPNRKMALRGSIATLRGSIATSRGSIAISRDSIAALRSSRCLSGLRNRAAGECAASYAKVHLLLRWYILQDAFYLMANLLTQN